MSNESYSVLAPYYDQLMDVDYQEWAEYLKSVWERFGSRPLKTIELACGTGKLTEQLATFGLQVTAIDRSAAMLAQAKNRLQNTPSVSVLQQDMRTLSLVESSFDLAICACDGINYLTTNEDLEAAFLAAASVVRTDGLFLFDLNSPWKLQELYGNQNFAELHEEFGFFWDNQWVDELRQTQMELTFFVPAEPGRYQRITEHHVQRLWTPPEIEKALIRTGWLFLDLFAFASFSEPEAQTERWQVVARRLAPDLPDAF